CHSSEKEAYMAYILEGLGNSYDSEMVMKYQMKNGSVLNSPSATAAALTRNQNAGFPTVYPLDLYFLLSMVNTLERLGITSHFLVEIQNILEETYRANGYQVSLDLLAKVTKKWDYMYLLEEPLKDVYAALEVSLNISNEDYLKLAVEDFNTRQSNYHEELKGLERWVVENRLDQLKFARQGTAACYVAAVLVLPSPELLDARSQRVPSFVTVSCRWNINVDTDCCSEEVRILFLALKAEVCWTIDKAFKLQARDITSHVIETLDLTKAMLRKHIWARDSYVPTINEFVENGRVAVALGPIVLAALLLMTPNLSQEIIQSSEYQNLYTITSTHCRLLNDIRSVKRDIREGRLNVLKLHENYGKSGIAEEVVKEIEMLIDDQKKKLMQQVWEPRECIVLRACKDAFWKMFSLVQKMESLDQMISVIS
ncbi:Ent-kaur-16-ene synthase, chloroplastic-like protein, partial [Tanacetum coccineum]